MGSQSDYPIMRNAEQILNKLQIKYQTRIVSAHRTPERLYEFAKEEKSAEVIIAGAGGAAHLPGMVASLTTIPVLGVPISTGKMQGLDSLLSIVQMPAGVPVGTLALDVAGAKNAAIFAAQILGNKYPKIKTMLQEWRLRQTQDVPEYPTVE